MKNVFMSIVKGLQTTLSIVCVAIITLVLIAMLIGLVKGGTEPLVAAGLLIESATTNEGALIGFFVMWTTLSITAYNLHLNKPQ